MKEHIATYTGVGRISDEVGQTTEVRYRLYHYRERLKSGAAGLEEIAGTIVGSNGLSLSPGQRFVLELQDGRKLNVIAQIANTVVATGGFILAAPQPRRSKPAS